MDSFLFGSELEKEGKDQGEKDGGGDACRGGGQGAFEYSDKAVSEDGFPRAFGHGVAEAQKGHRGAALSEIHDFLIDSDGRQNDARHHIARQYSGGGQAGFVDEQLSDKAQQTAGDKYFEIDHIFFLLKCVMCCEGEFWWGFGDLAVSIGERNTQHPRRA